MVSLREPVCKGVTVAFSARARYNTEKHTPRRGGKENFRVELTSYMLTTYWSISLALSDIIEEQTKWNRRIC